MISLNNIYIVFVNLVDQGGIFASAVIKCHLNQMNKNQNYSMFFKALSFKIYEKLPLVISASDLNDVTKSKTMIAEKLIQKSFSTIK